MDEAKITQSELDQFYAPRWKKRENRADSSSARERRLGLIYEALHNYLSKSPKPSEQIVLDYGCGAGWLLPYLQKRNFKELHAYDVTPSVTKYVAEQYPWVKVWTGNMVFPSVLPESYFDIVLSIEVIEHIPYEKQPAYMDDLRRIVHPGSLVVLTTPNGKWRDTALPPSKRQLVEDWVTLSQLKKLAEQSGFEVVRCGTKGIGRYSSADDWLQNYRLKLLLRHIAVWERYLGFLERCGRGITMYAYLFAE